MTRIRSTVRPALALALALFVTGCRVDELPLPDDPFDEAVEACSAADLEQVDGYFACLRVDRDARCVAAGVEPEGCDFPLAVSEPAAAGCVPPSEIDPACGAAFAPPVVGEAPLDCEAARRAIAAARAVYDDDPLARLDPAAWAVLGTYHSGNTVGFVGQYVEGGARACYVAFRGSDDVDDLLQSARSVVHAPCGALPGRCGDGFVEAYGQAVASGLVDAVVARVEGGGCDTLTVTGHSLGGAIADLMAAHLYQRDPVRYGRGFLDVQTFGAPRVYEAGGALAERLHAELDKTRWIRWGDPVPAVPLIDFGHVGTARLINNAFDWRARSTRWSFDVVDPDSSGAGLWPSNHQNSAYVEGLDRCE